MWLREFFAVFFSPAPAIFGSPSAVDGFAAQWTWRAVDDEGEALVVVQKRRDDAAALVLLKRLLRNQPVEPEAIVTDGLPSYGSAFSELALDHLH